MRFFQGCPALRRCATGVGFLCENADGNKPKEEHVRSIKQIEKTAKMTFFPNLAYEVSETVKCQTDVKVWK